VSARNTRKTESVARCVPRQDGGWLVVTLSGRSAVAFEPIPQGARIIIRDGRAMRPD
jgi:hypothetical protein